MKVNRKGFTIAELLIVVVIVGILVAVSIPLFSAKLERARETTDISVMRAAAALGQQFYYEGIRDPESARKAGMQWYKNGSDSAAGSNAFAIYLPDKGTFYDKDYTTLVNSGYKAYGKGRKQDGGVDLFREGNLRVYDPTIDYTKGVCQVSIFPNGSNKRVEVAWKEFKAGTTRPFIGNNKKGKDGNTYTENTYPRMVIYLE